eukprot:GFUD01025569.1.p1 GENE.GFUD01025569.1~~GFUD01025569.1.p1  ORF type:complete len:721 (+),score=203.23 GFUD01025569.1:280-2442(+)
MDNNLMMTGYSEVRDTMEEWEDQIVTENEEYFNESSDDNETGPKNKKDTKLKKFKNGFTKKVMSTLREDTKEKGGMMIQIFKEEWKSNRKSPDRPMTASTESLQSVKDEPVNDLEKDSESKLKKLRSGLGKKIKDIREDIVDIRDESLHSLHELKEIYQEKAEQKKAMITSFTEEEVKIFRKGSPLPPQVTKQMSSVYLARRFSIIRFTILGARNLDISRVKTSDNVFIKLSLGLERFKTRQVQASQSPIWMETSSLPRQTEEDEDLTVEVLARGSKETLLLGTGIINLSSLKNDSQNQVWIKLDGEFNDGELEVVIWVTGVNIDNDSKWLIVKDDKNNEGKFNFSKSFENISDVGYLTINVIEATGLGSTKLQGSVNPFCQLEMDNQFHRTVTAIKTKNPTWEKTFSFHVSDPFSKLNIAVLSEKMNSPQLVLGKAVLRLSSLGNSHNQHLWIALKDRKLRKPAKGDNPKLHLEIKYVRNTIRSAITVFKNKEDLLFEVPKPKFERTILLKNVNRIKQFLPKGSTITNIKKSYSDIIAWQNPARTVKYFVFYMFLVYYFHIWWIPVFLLYCLANNWKMKKSNNTKIPRIIVNKDLAEDDDDEEEETQEEKKSLKQSLDSLQNILQEFQEGCGLVASYLERISNLCHFEEPFLTVLFCGLLIVLSLVLWLFGLRTVLLLWGVNKFTKKLRDSNPVPTNEVNNLIIRVPDYEMVEDAKILD